MKCLLCKKTELNILERNLFDDRYGYPGKYSVRQCSDCRLGQTFPRLRKKEIPRIYNKYYPTHHKSPEQVINSVSSSNKILRWLYGTDNVAHLYANPGDFVLDIGSGSGTSLLEIHNLKAIGFGVEPDPSAQIISKKLGLKNVFEGEITQNPFPNIKFNLVTASQVIEHVSDPVSFVRAAKRKLKPSGKIIISTPNLNSLTRKILGRKWLHWHVPYHQNYFNHFSIHQLAEKSGLKIIKIRTITPNLWTILQLRRIFRETHAGSPDPLWNDTSGTVHKNRNGNILPNFVSKIVLSAATILLIPINRIIDAAGKGESLLIFLKKK